jgi:5-methylcytosine-specific restriction endonuclease McrA
VDHIRSRGAGGTDDMSNLRVLCVKCHDRRHNG